MKRFAFSAFVFLCAISAPAQMVSGGAFCTGGGICTTTSGPMNPVDMWSSYLNLTAAQQEQAKPLFNNERDATKNLFDSMKQAEDALTAAEKSNQPDSELDRLANAVGAVHAQMAAIHAKAMARFYAMLTPDQQDKLSKVMPPAGAQTFAMGVSSVRDK